MMQQRNGSAIRIVGWVCALAVISAIFAGLLLVGSPNTARQRRSDEMRAEDLSYLASDIWVFVNQNKRLPNTIGESEVPRRNAGARQDPITRKPYEYRKLNDSEFELCAVFETASKAKGNSSGWPYAVFTEHPKGRHCFKLPAKRPQWADDHPRPLDEYATESRVDQPAAFLPR